MKNDPEPTPDAVREQIAKLESNPIFTGSERLLVFLRFVVEEALKGRANELKEAVVGDAVYGRNPPYDPRIDSTVRVEARRLRRKLELYYASEGRSDPIRISLPTGGYAPTFAVLNDTESELFDERPQKEIFESGTGASIAVIPIRALSRNQEDERFADGLTDEVMYMLEKSPGLRVTSRSIVFQFKDKSFSAADVAAALGVHAVIQGTARMDGGNVRVTIEVSDPKGFIVWSDRFDAPAEEKVRLQEDIAATVLNRIKFDSSRMRARQIGPGPVALEAMAKVYRARQLLDRQSPDAIEEALEAFREVSRSAPDYARGFSGIADCHCDLFRLGLVDHETALAAATHAFQQALAIDPESIEAHSAAGTTAAWLAWDRDAAEEYFQRALKLGGNARASRLYAVFLTYVGRKEEAALRLREARASEPFSAQQDIAEALVDFQCRRFGSPPAGSWASRNLDVAVEALVLRALSLIFSGGSTAARAMLPTIGEATASRPDLALASAELEAWLGDKTRGAQLLQSAKGVTWFARATLSAALGDEQQALAALDQAVEQHELSAVWMPSDARFDRLREQPQFSVLIARIRPIA